MVPLNGQRSIKIIESSTIRQTGYSFLLVFYSSFVPKTHRFYRMMLCVSAVFAVARGVRLSVRLSRWCIVSTRLKISSNFFVDTVAPSFQILIPYAPIPNSKGNPFSGGAKYTRDWKILRFSTEIAVYLENGTAWLLQNVNRKSYALYRMVSYSMTLTYP